MAGTLKVLYLVIGFFNLNNMMKCPILDLKMSVVQHLYFPGSC